MGYSPKGSTLSSQELIKLRRMGDGCMCVIYDEERWRQMKEKRETDARIMHNDILSGLVCEASKAGYL